MALKILIIIGGICLILFTLWYRIKLKKLMEELSEKPDEVKSSEVEASKLKKMLYINVGIAVFTVILTIIELIKFF